MVKKSFLILAMVMALLLLSLASVSAITARIGNSRMVLHLEAGESVEKYVLVRNVNDVPVTIDLTVSGDLAENLVLDEETFELAPGEDKKAYFTITADEPGTSETKINVRFTPPEGAGVGVASNVIVFASGEDGNSTDENPDDTGFSFTPSGEDVSEDLLNSEGEGFKFTVLNILFISTLLLVVIFIILVVYQTKVKSKKGSRGPRA